MPKREESGIKIIAKFKEPLQEKEFTLALIPIEKLEVIEHQRKPSKFHVDRLKRSMDLLGFTTPVLVVERKNKYIIIDGQHRFLAAQEIGASYLPCIIVPENISYYLIELNAEKTLTIREKSYVALQIYNRLLKESSKLAEVSEEVQDSIEGNIYLVTLGLAYQKEKRFIGSVFESLVKRIDDPFDLPLKEAIVEREKRAEILLKTNKLVKDVATALKEELGRFPPFLYQSIVSYVSPIGRKRIVEESFDEVMKKIIDNLRELKKNPKVLLEAETLAETSTEERS